MESTKKIYSGFAWSIIYNVINALYGFVSVPILINFYGKGNYGLIGLALSVNVYVRLMDMGLNSTNIRFFSSWMAGGNTNRIKVGFQSSLAFYSIVGLINSAILLFVAFYAGSIFSVSDEDVSILRNLFFILALTTVVNWYSSSFDQLIRATENVAWIQKRSIITKVAQIISLALAVWLKLSIELYFTLSIISLFIILPFSVKKIKKELPYISFVPKWDRDIIKEILPYCLNVFSFSVFQFSFWNLRPILLGIGSSAEAVADFRVMNGIAGIITTLSGTFLGALLPSVSKAVTKGNEQAINRVAYDGTKYITLFLVLLCFGLLTISPELLTLYVGSDYLYLVPWLNIWSICLLGYSNQAISSLILSGTNLRPLAISSAIATILGLFSVWFLIPYFDVGAAVVGHVVYTVIQQLFYYIYYWPKVLNINTLRLFVRCVLPPIIMGSVSYCFTKLISHLISCDSVLMMLIISATIFSLSYFIGSLFLLGKADRRLIYSLIKNK